MVTITIPRKITNGKELIVVPKKDWENLLKIAKRKVYEAELEKGLKEALEEVKQGKVIGPFSKVDDLIKELEKK
jgi:hypothetical protein